MNFFDTPKSRYRSLGRIGRGGMAEVLLAATQSSGITKLAVLKCLWPDLVDEPGFVDMFLDEARLGARLAHPNVVQTYEVVEHEGRLAMAMEYVDGPSLRSVLARLPGDTLDLAARLRIISGLLAGLEYAHTLRALDGAPLNVVHRDVSPHNVIVTYDGHVKLLDFGIAKTLAARHQTRPGGVKGKLAYLAPEAIRGETVDRRADIYSAGVMLWEILAGRRLWGASTDGGLAWRLTHDAPPPRLPAELGLPDGLNEVCMRALALEPAARHQSAAELGAELERFGVEATDTHARRLGRAVAAAFAPERARRQAMIRAHLQAQSGADELVDYASYEVAWPDDSEDPSDSEATLVAASTSIQSRRPRAGRRGRAARVLVVAAAAAVVALASGGRVGPTRIELPTLPVVAEPAPSRVAPEAPAPAVEPVAVAPARRADRADRPSRTARGRRPRPLDLSSDDVLGLDGTPLAASGSTARE
jgi:serine/threonine-protein kinase